MSTEEKISNKFNELLEFLNKDISKKEAEGVVGSKFSRGIRKRVRGLEKDVKKILDKRKRIKGKRTGFNISYAISDELREFLQVDKEATLNRAEITTGICVYCYLSPTETREKVLRWKHLNTEGRNLRAENEKTVIYPDDKLSKLLGYKKYCKDVEAGVYHKTVTDRATRLKRRVVEKDTRLKYCKIQILINKHIIRN